MTLLGLLDKLLGPGCDCCCCQGSCPEPHQDQCECEDCEEKEFDD